jgi:shikimate dehydrogenase
MSLSPTQSQAPLKLGLIGDNIKQSSAPRLHKIAGRLNARAVSYDLLIPPEREETFLEVFDAAQIGGYSGLNITYPYKEKVVPLLKLADPVLEAVGAVNTVLFTAHGPVGYNTDYTGFKAAYQATRGADAPSEVLIIGSGGVGRAIAFGLADLGASALHLVDTDLAKANGLKRDLARGFPALRVTTMREISKLPHEVTGLANATPIGMVGYGGTPMPEALMREAKWVFDAVYTPLETPFLKDAAALGLEIISGWELFFYQGVHAWAHFSGGSVDEAALRTALLQA